MAFNIRRWTPAEDELLFKRIEAGETQSSIARSFPGRSEKSVFSRLGKLRSRDAHTLDLRKARNSSEKLSNAVKRLLETMTPAQVADVLGGVRLVTPGTENIVRGQAAERRLAA